VVEWGVVAGVIGYALLIFTVGVLLLPLFTKKETTHSG
jgi:Ni/Fe-hydrogenase subunit HybB-like protein